MLRIGSTHWLHTTTAPGTATLLTMDLATGRIDSAYFDSSTRGYLRDTVWRVLSKLPAGEREQAAPILLERVVAATTLTGDSSLFFSVGGGRAIVSIIGLESSEELLIQIPFSGSMAMLPPTGAVQKFDYRHETLGDGETGFYHVTVAARGASETAIEGIEIYKSEAFSTPGAIGTFAIDIRGTLGLFLHSVTVTTYTRAETQAKLVVVLDNPQGPTLAHRFVRPSATVFTTNGSQSATPIVSVAGADGALPAANGVPHQLDPTFEYARIRVAAAGLAQATDNVVTDPEYNKVQSLVLQF